MGILKYPGRSLGRWTGELEAVTGGVMSPKAGVTNGFGTLHGLGVGVEDSGSDFGDIGRGDSPVPSENQGFLKISSILSM